MIDALTAISLTAVLAGLIWCFCGACEAIRQMAKDVRRFVDAADENERNARGE